jgi:hypothetical protein
VASGATTFTVTPTYTGCNAFIGETKAPTTITTNGCDFVLHIGLLLTPPRFAISYEIVCPAGAQMEIHSYTSSTHASTICTVKIPAQTGLTNGTVETSGSNLHLGGPVGGIKETKTGILCGGAGETTVGEWDVNDTIIGKSGGGAATAISVSGT